MSKVSLTPFVGVQFTRLWQPTYTETSIDISDGLPGVMGQTYQANTITSLPTSLGVQFDTRVPIGGTLLTPYVRVAWLHNLSSMPNTTVISTINVVSSLEGTAAPTDSALVNAGALLSLGPNIALFGKFTGQFADTLQTYAGTGGLRIAW
jgi:outer membrane autotransporter protein